MPALSDVRFEKLRALGYTGSTSDMLLEWLQDGGPSGIPILPSPATVPDAWEAVLKQLDDTDLSFTPPGVYNRNTWWFEWLGYQSHTGNLNDRELQFWQSVTP